MIRVHRNIVILEAQEKLNNYASTITDLKKMLNTCILAKCKNDESNFSFFSVYFNNNVEGNDPLKTWKLKDWLSMYNDTLCTDKFYQNLSVFMSLYKAKTFTDVFGGMRYALGLEVEEEKNPRMYLNSVKASLTMMRTKFEAIFNLILPQVRFDSDVIKSKRALLAIIDEMLLFIDKKLIDLNNPDKPSAKIQKENLENGKFEEPIDESVVDKAKTAAVDFKKIEEAFDRNILQAVNKLRDNRRKMKHAEMVGESLRISREIKRVFATLPVFLINPAVGAIIFVGSIIYDNKTDVRDKAVLIGDLKLEIKIIEQKIETAERKGDDKEKIQLMRAKDKLDRELERLQNNRPAY